MRVIIFSCFAFAVAVFLATAAVYHVFYPQAADLRVAHQQYLLKNYQEARVRYEQAAGKGQRLPEIALQRLLEIYFRDKNFKAADALLQDWPYPKKKELLISSIGMADLFGRYEQALALYAQSPELQKEQILHYTDLQVRTRDFEGAKKSLRQVIAENPKHTKALYVLAEILSWQKSYAEAEQLLLKVLTLDKNNISAKLLLARILSWKGDFETSAQVYREVLLNQGQAL